MAVNLAIESLKPALVLQSGVLREGTLPQLQFLVSLLKVKMQAGVPVD